MKKDDINVIIIAMDYGMHGTSVLNHDGSTTVFLNARDSHERRLKTYKHEIDHDDSDDFDKHDVQQIEYEAHKGGST